MLKDIIIDTTYQIILSFLSSRPDQLLYVREISERAKVSLGATNKALKELHRRGLVIREKRGKTHLYTLDEQNPFLRQFRILNTILSLEPIVKMLEAISRRVLLYGSCAKGTNTGESDLDLFIVSNSRDEVMSILEPYLNPSDEWPYRLRPVIRSTSEWSYLEERDPTFFNEIADGVVLWEQTDREF